MHLLLNQTPVLWYFVALAFALGYLSGSVPYGLLLGKLMGAGDIRESGSNNIGATNALRVGGKRLAIITLLCDILKGAIPVAIAAHYSSDYAVVAAVGAFLGHIFPVWLKFKGGKGVAVAIGVSLGFSLYLGLAICAVWLVIAFTTKYSSLAALLSFALAPVIAWFMLSSSQIAIALLVITVLIFIRHHENIARLIKGEESKIKLKKSA